MNSCTFIGNLTADAQQKNMNVNGAQSAFCTFDIAVNRKTRNGEEVLFISCIKNGDNTNLLPYLTKGRKVAVHGRIGVHAYADKQGQPRASLDLSVFELELVGGGNEGQQPQTASAAPTTAQAPTPNPFPASSSPYAAQQGAPAPQPTLEQKAVTDLFNVNTGNLPF